MAGMAGKMVKQYFEAQDTNPEMLQDNVLRIGWRFEGSSIQIYLEFDESDTHVHVEGVNFIDVPKEKYEKIYPVLNELNDKYVHVKFVLDLEHGQICARDDDVIQLDSCGPECFELMLRMVQIVEDAYPSFMKAMWA